jgi:signal transduction histidine kinase
MLSRRLHDQVAQSIAAGLNLLTLSDHYRGAGDPELASRKRAEAETAIRYALNVTKELATSLRLDTDLVRHRTVSPTGNGNTPPTAPAELLLIVREALHNALAHANASTITIRFSADRDAFSASIVDDGIGLPEGRVDSQSSLGLQSMKERTALLGGRCRIGAGRGAGTEVRVKVPCTLQP